MEQFDNFDERAWERQTLKPHLNGIKNPPREIIKFVQFIFIKLALISPNICSMFIDKGFTKLQSGIIVDYSVRIHKLVNVVQSYKEYIKNFEYIVISKRDMHIIESFSFFYSQLINALNIITKKLNKSTPQEKIEINNIIIGLKETIDILIPLANKVIKIYNDENNDKLDYLEIKY
jgi:hypothetical protein